MGILSWNRPLCSARYTALQMKNSTRNFSAMNPVTTEKAGEKHDTVL